MVSIFIAIVLAALAYMLCMALHLPPIVGIIAAVLVLLGGVGHYGYGHRGPRA